MLGQYGPRDGLLTMQGCPWLCNGHSHEGVAWMLHLSGISLACSPPDTSWHKGGGGSSFR